MIRTLRAISQLTFFALAVAVFGAFGLPQAVVQAYHALAIYPSLSFLGWLTLPPLVFVTLTMVVLPLLLGRVYCGWMCPAGAAQDLIWRLTHRIFPTRAPPNLPRWRLALWLGCLVLVISGSSLYGWLDHHSNVGRSIAVFSNPSWPGWLMAAVFLILILIVPLVWPRFYCATLCPSGALFASIQRFSFFKIRTRPGCVHCGGCETICPAGCLHDGRIDYGLCMHCLECTTRCAENVFTFTRWRKKKRDSATTHESPRTGLLRRAFLGTAAALAGVAGGLGLTRLIAAPAGSTARTIVPPGAKSEAQFLARCTACHLCVGVCPTKVLQPARGENGIIGAAKPRMEYDHSWCSYECNACLGVCPTEAISWLELRQKKLIKLGNVELDTHTCIPFVEERDCGACAEHCPTGAVSMQRLGKRFIPVIRQPLCIGCGSCQRACPIGPPRAIRVVPVAIHTMADDPLAGDVNMPRPAETPGDFPF